MRSVLLVVVAVLIVVPGVAVLVAYAAHHADVHIPVAASPTTFTVDGHPYSCGDDGTVTLTVTFSYPGPTYGAYLDGVKLLDGPGSSPGGAYFPVVEPTTFRCGQHATHHLRQDVGRSTEHYVGCGITLTGSHIAGEGEVTSGKNVTPTTNVWHASDTVCDATWST